MVNGSKTLDAPAHSSGLGSSQCCLSDPPLPPRSCLWGCVNACVVVREPVPSAGPPASQGHSAVLHRGKVCVFGGVTDAAEYDGMVKMYDVASAAWTIVQRRCPFRREVCPVRDFCARRGPWGGMGLATEHP